MVIEHPVDFKPRSSRACFVLAVRGIPVIY